MISRQIVIRARFYASCLSALMFLCGCSASGQTGGSAIPPHVRPSNDALTFKAQEHFYNMEYDQAIRDYAEVLKMHPQDPFAYNYLAAAIVFKELYRIGAMEAESYANESFLDIKAKRPLDPEVRKRALSLIEKSESLCNARLQANPRDVDALYARGVERGMKSTYMGLGEKAWLPAIRSALAARRDHEKVLEIDPSYLDAKLVVGMHNYIIGSLNWAYRMAVALVGVSGNKQKGMAYIREVAYGDSLASMDAKIALALFLRHAQAYDECLKLVKGMTERYPRNFVAALEYGNTLNAAGKGREALEYYEQLLAAIKAGKFPLAQPELVEIGLGISARGQRQFELAAKSFDEAAAVPDADAETTRRATLLAGEMWDELGHRELALEKYRKVVATGSNPEADRAKKRIKQPYRYVEKQ
jgi:tetratricopeptide (TPR) repeat protein